MVKRSRQAPLPPHDYPLTAATFQNQYRYGKVPMGGSSAALWARPIIPAIQLDDYEDTGIENRMQAATQERIGRETLYKSLDTRTSTFGKIGACAMPPIQPQRSILTPSYDLADTHPAYPAMDEIYRKVLFNNFLETPIITNDLLEGGLFVNTVTA